MLIVACLLTELDEECGSPTSASLFRVIEFSAEPLYQTIVKGINWKVLQQVTGVKSRRLPNFLSREKIVRISFLSRVRIIIKSVLLLLFEINIIMCNRCFVRTCKINGFQPSVPISNGMK